MELRFERGTVVLRDPPENTDLTDLPGVLWDPRIRALRAPAMHTSAIRESLEARGVHFTDLVGRPADLPSPLPTPSLRPYQSDALWAWECAGRRGVVVLPTGSGKTRLALAAIATLSAPALVIVPTRVLLDQWVRELTAAYEQPIGALGDGKHVIGSITVATYESAWRHVEELGARFQLLVVDEVHHFGDGRRDEALELSIAPWRLGLTATPPHDGAEQLAQLVGPIVFELAVGDLAGSWLAPFEHVTLRLELDRSERRAWDAATAAYRPALQAYLREAPGAGWADFARAAARTEAGRAALAAFKRSRALLVFPSAKRKAVAGLLTRHSSSRVLVFTADNVTAHAIALEHLVMPITCDISRTERAAALARFRDGALRTLVSARVLDEGIDVPEADVAIIVGGTHGQRQHVQRIGRLLRPREDKTAVVYELVMRGTPEVAQATRRRAGLAARQPDPY